MDTSKSNDPKDTQTVGDAAMQGQALLTKGGPAPSVDLATSGTLKEVQEQQEVVQGIQTTMYQKNHPRRVLGQLSILGIKGGPS